MNGFAYKWLGGPDGLSSVHGGDLEWVVDEWVSVQAPVVPCKRGIHLCRREDVLSWCAPALWIAEYDGELVADNDKIVVERARLVRRVETWTLASARLFAADCAERALLRERAAGREPHAASWAAVEAARAYARDEITSAERAAAWAAARAADRAAAGAAAWAAARAAAWAAAGAAARDAARAAAGAAAGAAARDAARAAEHSWQLDHLFSAYLTDAVLPEVSDA